MSTRPSADKIAGPPACATRIELCGSLRAEIEGRSVSALLPGRQGRSLFAFLVVNRHRPVGRRELHDVLWPSGLPEEPEAHVSTVLARVRRVVGVGVIEGRAELELHLEPDALVDVEQARADAQSAERSLAEGRSEAALATAERALQVIARPLLPGIEGAWVDTLQADLIDLEPGLLEVVARAGLDLGGERLATAERVASTLVDRHPFREAGYALLIEVQARRGNVAEATRTYHRLRELLREELGTVPSAAVSALHEALLHSRGAVPGAGGSGEGRVPLPQVGGAQPLTPFVGRGEQLERLRALWRVAAEGELPFAVAVGEAGVGKTRLAAHFASELHAAGATVLYGRCDEEPLLVYQPVVEALRHYVRHGDWRASDDVSAELLELSRLIPEAEVGRSGAVPPPRDPESARYFLFEAVATLLRQAAASRPLLLVFDDLHWADRPTLLLLRHLLRQGKAPGLMVLGLFRDVEVGAQHPLAALVADLRRECRFERMALEGFDEQESGALVSAYLEAPASDAFVRGLRTRTEGNPLFMQEALRSLIETEAVSPGEEVSEWALRSVGVPESLADVILRRLGRVSELTSDTLTVAAVIGREFDARVTAAVLETPADGVIAALEEAMDAGLVAEVGDTVDRFAFCHALVREAIMERLSQSRRLRLQLTVASALEAGGGAEGAGAGELAHHFFLARQVGGAEKAIRYALSAADDASRALAHEEAAAHYRRALEVLALDEAGDDELRCDVLLALGRVQWRAGDSAARETYFEAAAGARRRGASEQLARAALGLGERYWEAKAVDDRYRELLGEALDTLGEVDTAVRARLIARLAENLHFTPAQQQRAQELSLEAVAMARRLGDVDTLVAALMARHVAVLHIDHLEERLALIDEVLVLTRDHRALSAEACHWQLFDLCELGDVDTARRRRVELAGLAEDLRQPLLQHLAIGWEAVFALLAGDVEETERLAHESFEFGRRAQVGDANSSLTSMLFVLRRLQGRLAELLPAMESLIEEAPSAPVAWRAALALANLDSGSAERGRDLYERLVVDDFAAIPRDWYWFVTIALLAEAGVALGDAERAAHLYELLLPYSARSPQAIFAVCFGSVERQLGMLAGVMGRVEDAERHFRAAIQANERMGAPLMTAATRCEYGALLLRRGGEGDRERAAALGASIEQVAAPRGLAGLRALARGLTREGH